MALENDNKEIRLIFRLKQGDYSAFEELYRLYSPRLYNFVNSILFNKSQAEDITQICFTKIWEKKADLDISGNFSAYLYTIARNQVYLEVDRQIRDAKYLQSVQKMEPEATSTTEEEIDARILYQNISKLLEELPQTRRNIFRLSRFKGYSNKEIANQLSISERTVETQIYRTLSFLKKRLKDYLLLIF